ncbi:MAG: hypothetical protein EZS28_032451, partial [Streblomastix strix]
MKSQGLTVDKPTTKLTALLSTHNQFMCFTSYILWFLIDYCNLIIDGIDSIALFDKHLSFESFACTMMSKRQDAISQHNDKKSLYYKQILNSAFRGEGQNNAKIIRQQGNQVMIFAILMVKLLKKHNIWLMNHPDNLNVISPFRKLSSLQTIASFATTGSKIEGYKYGLKYVIKDQEFNDQHYKEWLPWDDRTVAEEKKLMGITTESQGENI